MHKYTPNPISSESLSTTANSLMSPEEAVRSLVWWFETVEAGLELWLKEKPDLEAYQEAISLHQKKKACCMHVLNLSL